MLLSLVIVLLVVVSGFGFVAGCAVVLHRFDALLVGAGVSGFFGFLALLFVVVVLVVGSAWWFVAVPRVARFLLGVLRRFAVARALITVVLAGAVLFISPASVFAPRGVASLEFVDSFSGGPGIACESFVVDVRPAGGIWIRFAESYDASDGPSQSAYWLDAALAQGFVPVSRW